MLHLLGNRKLLITSMIMTSIMFCIVMFFANPLIDGKNGMGLLALQLAFEKTSGMAIVNSWGPLGIERFNRWIFTDYIYALSYTAFFVSLLSWLMLKNGITDKSRHALVLYAPLVAGSMDWIENTMEIFFLKSPEDFSNALFFVHSLVSTIKWSALPIVIVYIVALLIRQRSKPMPTNHRTPI